MAELEAVLTALQVTTAERQQALGLLEAPRAVQQLRAIEGAGPPVSGDLLRAMRLRHGWTQQETANRLGIAQGTLARWERSLDWPAPERLHALCFVLHAHEEELIALTQGYPFLTPSSDTPLDPGEIERRISHSMFYSPVADLDFLALEAQLWHLSRTFPAVQLSLSHAYGCHARYLVERHRFHEADLYVERTQQLAKSGYRDDNGWSSAIIAAARVAASGGRPLHVKRALNILHTWAERSPILHLKEYQAWIASEMAFCLLKMGHGESALLQSRRALRIVASMDDREDEELWWRRADHAKILLEMGRYREALEECNACLSLGNSPLQSLPFMLIGAQALLGVHRFDEATAWLQRTEQIIDTYPQAKPHRVSANALRQRLPRTV